MLMMNQFCLSPACVIFYAPFHRSHMRDSHCEYFDCSRFILCNKCLNLICNVEMSVTVTL